MRIDEKFVVSSIDRVVEHGVVKPELSTCRGDICEPDQRGTDSGAVRFTDPLLSASIGDMGAFRISKRDANSNAWRKHNTAPR